MNLIAATTAVEFIQRRGGELYIWKKRSRCCGGAFVTLGAATEAPIGVEFRSVAHTDDFELFVPATMQQLPDELRVEARRFPNRIEAYWNGCAWIV